MRDEVDSVEVVPFGQGTEAVEAIERAQIDTQIATAHRFPRSLAVFKKRALEMVTLDEDTAASCIYRRPVGKKRTEDGKQVVEYAEGKSIRMAEIVGSCFGNLRVGAIIVEMQPRFVKARGMAHDLESNFAASSEVVESTVDRQGNPYSERMRVVVAKAALSKARRDATFQVVPQALCKTLEDSARTTAIGDTQTLAKRRANVEQWINLLGIDKARVWAALGIKGIEDVGLEQLETLTGLRTAIKDKDITLDEAFPATEQAETAPTAAPGVSLSARMGAPADKTKTDEPKAEAPTETKPETKPESKPDPKPEAQSPGPQPVPREALVAELRALMGPDSHVKASAIDAALKAVGVNFDAGESWEQLPDDKLDALAVILKDDTAKQKRSRKTA